MVGSADTELPGNNVWCILRLGCCVTQKGPWVGVGQGAPAAEAEIVSALND